MNLRPIDHHDKNSSGLPVLQNVSGDSPAEAPTSGCCGLRRVFTPGAAMRMMFATTLAALAAAGYFAGVASGLRTGSDSVAAWEGLPPGVGFPPGIDATGAVSSDKYSIATGLISEEVEGFFVLDHNSGVLQCIVFNPRVGKFMANFTVNAGEMLGTGTKGAQYLMVTGHTDMSLAGRGAVLSPSLVYVLNTANGNYAAFSIPFDRQVGIRNRPQQGVLIPVGTGTASVVPTR